LCIAAHPTDAEIRALYFYTIIQFNTCLQGVLHLPNDMAKTTTIYEDTQVGFGIMVVG
jgi:hypothetical protein